MKLSASSLWRSELCPASAVLPHTKERYADAERGKREHAALEASPPAGSIPEVAFAYDVSSSRAREVGRSIGREYGILKETEIPGTADLVTLASDHVLVTDYKSGVGYLQAEPAINLQLQHNALSAALVFERPRAIVQLIYLKTGEVKDAEFDAFDLIHIGGRLRSIWERCRAPIPEVVPDLQVQCWRCPAKRACPAHARRSA